MAVLTKPKSIPRHTLLPDSRLCVRWRPRLSLSGSCITNTIPGDCEQTEPTERGAQATPAGAASLNRALVAPASRACRRALSKLNRKQRVPGQWRRSKTCTQTSKVQHYFAACPGATWKILSGNQAPNVQLCLRKTRERGGWGTAFKRQCSGLFNARMTSYTWQDGEEQKIVEPGKLDWYIHFLFLT